MSKNKQTEANKKWQDQNKERARYLQNRSAARSFIRVRANLEDLKELEEMIKERYKEIKQSPGES
ncbi:hypothetical protein ACTHQ4_10060 [Alkalicoccobacillus gibsonii]|uniref:hypothetical protein n=1 Tax=Alkalicoccobacillus gibsonii TaxID=79881 RepID=UPI003F7C7ECD